MRLNIKPILIATALLSPSLAFAQTEIQLWHSMTGALGDKVGELATKFNATQTEYQVLPVFKGS